MSGTQGRGTVLVKSKSRAFLRSCHLIMLTSCNRFALAHMRLVLARLIWKYVTEPASRSVDTDVLVRSFDMELCTESQSLMDVGASVLVYHKEPLMIRLELVKR